MDEHNIDLVFPGINNLSTAYYVKCIIDDKDTLVSIVENTPTEINNEDDALCYLFIKFLSEMSKAVPYVNPEFHDDYLCIIKIASDKEKEFGSRTVPQYIEENLDRLLENSYLKNGLLHQFDINVNIIKKSTIETILTKEFQHIVSSFKIYRNRIVSDYRLLSLYVSEDSFSKAGMYSVEYIRSIIEAYNKTECASRDLFETISNIIACKCEELSEEIEKGKSIDFDILELYVQYLRKFNRCSQRSRDILKERRRYEEKYLVEHGAIIEHDVEIGKIVKDLLRDGGLLGLKLGATHYKEGDGVKSCFEQKISNSVFIDAFFTGKKSEYFTGSRQDMIHQITNMGTAIIQHLANTVSREELLNADTQLVAELYNNIQNIELCSEILQMYDEDYEMLRSECSFQSIYGSCMYTISMTEKLLRTFVSVNEDANKYDNLSRLLDDPFLNDALGKDLIKGIQYCLSTQDGIGWDWRNRIAHWDHITREDINHYTLSLFLYLFNCSLNSILFYSWEKSKYIEKKT